MEYCILKRRNLLHTKHKISSAAVKKWYQSNCTCEYFKSKYTYNSFINIIIATELL